MHYYRVSNGGLSPPYRSTEGAESVILIFMAYLRTACVALQSCLLLAAFGCDKPGIAPATQSAPAPKAAADAPNILLIVWDTVRSDYVSAYGHEMPTTPKLDAWAKGARVFEDCISPGSTTLPTHASIFTGLLPTEHGVSHARERLDDSFDTLAEHLQRGGYRTYLFSANNFISDDFGFTQGFEKSEHPWSERFAARAFEIVKAKVAADRSSELTDRMARGPEFAIRVRQNIKAAGELAVEGVCDWLKEGDAKKPYFVFVNWMEAHRQLIPARKYRERFMTPAQVEQSYKIDRRWSTTWEYTAGLREFSGDEIALTRATYEAAIAELDDLFSSMLDGLRAAGRLDNTVVIVTSDHGEHLGEHHMLDHQFSVYEELLRVPLIIHDPRGFPAGREGRPVMTQDLFATLLGRAGLPVPRTARHSIDLRTPQAARPRLSEYPAAMLDPLKDLLKAHPDFDLKPWARSLRVWRNGDFKLIRSSDGRHELYNLKLDPHEQKNLAQADSAAVDRLMAEMMGFKKQLRRPPVPANSTKVSDDANARKTATGYGGGAEEDESWFAE